MSKEKNKMGIFIKDWLDKVKQGKPDSVIIQAIYNASEDGQLDETKLLRSLREEAKAAEERKKA